jgi:hypothetical protein
VTAAAGLIAAELELRVGLRAAGGDHEHDGDD